MNKIIFCFILILILKLSAFSQEIILQKIIPLLIERKIDIGYVNNTNDNGIILSYMMNTYRDFYIIKLDSNFNTDWSYLLDSSYAYLDYFSNYLTQNNDLTYSFFAVQMFDYFFDYGKLFKFDLSSLGDSLEINIKFDSTLYIKGVPKFYYLDNGSYIYSVSEWVNSNFLGIYWIKINNKADRIWRKKLLDSTNKIAGITQPVRTLDNGFIFTTSIIVDFNQPRTYMYLIKTDDECNEILRKKLDFGKYDIYRNKIIPVKDGGYVFTLSIIDTTNDEKYLAVVKVDNNLDTLWMKLFQGDKKTRAWDLTSNEQGDLFILGVSSKLKYNSRIDSSTQKGYLLKLNSNGVKIWDIKLGQDSVYNDFQYILNAGNNEYYCVGDSRDSIMLIKIRDNSTAVKEIINKNWFSITPNPFSSSINIEFTNFTTSKVNIELYDILGYKIFTDNLGFLESGQHNTTIQLNENFSPGCYLLVIRSGADIQSMKVVKSE